MKKPLNSALFPLVAFWALVTAVFLVALSVSGLLQAAPYAPIRDNNAGPATYTAIDHDDLTNFVLAEHIDWTQDQGATNIHAGNIPDLSSVYATAAQGSTADSALQPGDIDTLSELNTLLGDATLIDTGDSRLSDSRDAISLRSVSLDSSVGSPSDGKVLVYRTAGTDWVLEDLPSGAAETNSLETTVTGINDTEIFIGTGPDAGNFTAVTGALSLSNAGIAALTSDSVTPNAIQSAGKVDEYCLTYEETGETLSWQVCAAGSSFTTIDADYGNETVVSDWVFQGAGSTGGKGAWDLSVGNGADYGGLRFGDAGLYRSSYSQVNLDLGGAVVVWNEGSLDAANDPGIEFAIFEDSNSVRLAIPESGSGNATAMVRSVTVAGPYTATVGNDIVLCDQWSSYDSNIDCDTGTTGADLFVQDDLELEGEFFSSGTIHLDADDANQLTISAANQTAAHALILPNDELAAGDLLFGGASGALTYGKISALTEESAPTTGDWLLAEEAGGAVRKVDVGDLFLPIPAYTETGVTAGIQSAGTLTVALDGRIYEHTLTANVTAWSVTAPTPPASGSAVVILVQDATARTVAWPAAWKWPDGTASTMPTTSGARLELVVRSTPSGALHASGSEYAAP